MRDVFETSPFKGLTNQYGDTVFTNVPVGSNDIEVKFAGMIIGNTTIDIALQLENIRYRVNWNFTVDQAAEMLLQMIKSWMISQLVGSSGTTSIPTNTPVQPTNGAGYLGCYMDWTTRALPTQLISSGATIDSCKSAARARGFIYAGLQDGGQCFGGNGLGYQRMDDSECNRVCTANASQYCGGAWRNSIVPLLFFVTQEVSK